MKENNIAGDRFRKYLTTAIFVVLILSVYMAGYIRVFLKTLSNRAALNPITQIKYSVEYGWPTGWFLLFFFLIGSVAIGFIYKRYKDTEGLDKMGRQFKHTVGKQTYGDSHFESPEEYKELASIQSPEHAYGTILGQVGDDGKKLINFRMDNTRVNKHIAVIGASGSGKTYTFSKPYCYQAVKRRESVVITDPDGGLYRDLAGYFEDNGYVVRRFDLTNLQKSDGWDCLKSITPENAELDAQLFAQVVISNTMDDTTSIYATGPMSLLKALILRVYLDPERPPEQKNIGEVYSMLQNPMGEEFLDTLFEEHSLCDELKPCLGPYLSFKQGSPNLRGNLITNLSVQLQLLQNKLVCKVLSTDDIDLLLPGQQPCAYFCLFPDSHDTFKFIVSLFFSCLFTNLIAFADQKCGGALPVPVNFLLDEFPSIGRLPDWDKKLAVVRKRNMSIVMIFQNITQLVNLYETAWQTIFSNCATWVALGINDEETAKLFSSRIGETSVEASTKKIKPATALLTPDAFREHSEGEGKRSLLNVDEMQKLDENDLIVVFQNHNPIWAKKYPHVLHPDSKKCRKILPNEIPDITDTEGRKKHKQNEANRINEFYAEHPELVNFDRNYKGKCESDTDESDSVMAKIVRKSRTDKTVKEEQVKEKRKDKCKAKRKTRKQNSETKIEDIADNIDQILSSPTDSKNQGVDNSASSVNIGDENASVNACPENTADSMNDDIESNEIGGINTADELESSIDFPDSGLQPESTTVVEDDTAEQNSTGNESKKEKSDEKRKKQVIGTSKEHSEEKKNFGYYQPEPGSLEKDKPNLPGKRKRPDITINP